ncbi:ATP synthase F1 subunit gamma [Alkalibaculum sp. M08DMB]|uniref:ATP synthase gamma chain n=1 Tax=Alkalibaculum sporogenes TaxID=2655001 RepID=A0A6A7KCH4_9FIRM|nr:ATP synthase F1 subunit gamma [Alkalibaculum sporogenes]MPW27001.1 ATP synthase F1 subunit gamma [Alkalibaculum sporogenes]
MAENMRVIKRRIKSVNSTKQITHAMELVASSKLRKARQKAEARRAYFEVMIQSMRELATHQSGSSKNIYLQEREGKKTLTVLVTADKGLAGGYNSNVIKLAASKYKESEESSLIIVGNKGREYFKNRDANIIADYVGISENPTYNEAKEIGKKAISLYKDGQIDEVYLAYTKFESTISHKAKLIKLLPLDKDEFVEEEAEDSSEIPLIMQYEPSVESLLNYLIPKYVSNTIYGAMIEGSASEQGARRIAMESATENANEMIDSLTLRYNRARQEQITQEIAEIVAGANASK